MALSDVLRLVLLFLIALAPPIILAIRLRNAEEHRPEPWRVLSYAFLWGATLAAILSIVVQTSLDDRFRRVLIPATALSVLTVVIAPLSEELSKALGLRLIDDKHPEPEDGYIYGGAVGLGFAATENLIYILEAYAVGGEQLATATAFYRGVATVALHGAASAIAGHGIWRARYGGHGAWALWGVGSAILLHVAYNALVATQAGWATLGAAGIAIVAYMRMMRRVRVLDEAGVPRE